MSSNWLQLLRGSAYASRHGCFLRIRHHMARKHKPAFGEAAKWCLREYNDYQQMRLSEMIEHAICNVPYYSKHKDDYVGKSLHEMPVLAKHDVRQAPRHFYARNVRKYRAHTTSGTSGSQLTIRMSYHTHSLMQAGMERNYEQYGLSGISRLVALTGFFRPSVAAEGPISWRDYIGRRLFFNIYQMKDGNVDRYRKAFCRFKPSAVFGYASAVYLLASLFQRNNIDIPKGIKVCMTTSEVLFDDWREVIENVFKAPVADQYGSQEGQCLATECPAGIKHINPEHGIMEVVDDKGKPVPPGAEGRILLTGIGNDAMPLIRYDIGDIASMPELSKPCSCGLRWPVLGKVSGRSGDIVWTPDGRPITYLDYHATKDVPGIIESQFIQDQEDHLRVLIVKSEDFSSEQEAAVRGEIQRRCQYSFRVDMEYVESIPRGARGKFKAVVCLLNDKA